MTETWQEARLIPTSGISGPDEAERRATSALLAVMAAVKEFGAAIVRPLGAPAGPISTFIEVPFELDDRTVRPDGVIQITRAGRTWTAIVEVKTGDNPLTRDQIESYLDVARSIGADVVLTISNQIAPAPGVHPVEVDGRRLRSVALRHLSWAEVLTIAVQQRVHRGVSDPDQAWILGELIRYLEHPKSGALDFSDMGGFWVQVRDAALARTLRQGDKGLADVVSRWDQLLTFAVLRLERDLGVDVQLVLSRRESADPTLRSADLAAALVERGELSGSIRIPGTVAPLRVIADLRASTVTCSVDIEAPREGRPATRVNWLLRQLKDAQDGLRIEAWTMNARSSMSELLGKVRQDPMIIVDDPRRDLKMFRVAATSALGSKRGTGRGSFIDSVLSAIDGFYGSVLQAIGSWSPRPPQMPLDGQTAVEAAGIDTAPPPTDLVDIADEAPLAEADADLAEPIVNPWPAPTVEWASAQVRLDRERGEAQPLPPPLPAPAGDVLSAGQPSSV